MATVKIESSTHQLASKKIPTHHVEPVVRRQKSPYSSSVNMKSVRTFLLILIFIFSFISIFVRLTSVITSSSHAFFLIIDLIVFISAIILLTFYSLTHAEKKTQSSGLKVFLVLIILFVQLLALIGDIGILCNENFDDRGIYFEVYAAISVFSLPATMILLLLRIKNMVKAYLVKN